MAGLYPSVNDRDWNLLNKICQNTAGIADLEAGDVASVTGTTNQITASPNTGAVVLSIPSTFIAPGTIASTTTIKAGSSFIGLNGQTITGNASGAWAITANGTNQSITLTPSGTGIIAIPDGGKLGQTGYGLYVDSTQVQLQANSTSFITGTSTVTTLRAGGSTTGVFSSTAGIALTALGTNQSITLTPSGTGQVVATAGGAATAQLLVLASAAVSPAIELKDAAGTPNRWWVGSGAVSTTDGKFFIYDARQSAIRAVIGTTGNLLVGGLTTDGTNGVIQLPAASAIAGGVGFGTDWGLYRLSSTKFAIDAPGAGTTQVVWKNNGGEAVSITASGSSMLLGTNGTTTALTLDSSQVATFAQCIKISGAATTSGAGILSIGNTTQSTVGAAGGASALPATPTGYIKTFIGSTQFVIPYYAQA